jgi:hypothetical protein
MNQKSHSVALFAKNQCLQVLPDFCALENAQELTAHTRKAKLFRQSKSFVTFGIFVSNKAFRSSVLALQVFAKR